MKLKYSDVEYTAKNFFILIYLFILLTACNASPGKPLSLDRNERRIQLIEQIIDHELASIFRGIRDLTRNKRHKKMNDNDNSTLERSRDFLINEWSLALSIPVQQTENELRKLQDGVKNNS